MSIRVHIPTPMRQHTQGQAVVEVSGSTVQSALDDLGKKYDGITQRVFEIQGRLQGQLAQAASALQARGDGT